MEENLVSPLDEMYCSLSEDARNEFYVAPLDRDYFDAWVDWIATTLDPVPPQKRRDVLFEILSQASFTNAEMGLAGDWIVKHNERFPVPAHFLGCPELGRNAGRG